MKKLLIIEDDPDILQVLSELSGHFGWEVILRPAIISTKEVRQIAPDLILLDHRVEHQLGGDFIYHLKHTPQTKAIPVILMSAITNVSDIALANGADGSIAKPFGLEEIQAVLEAYF